MTKAALLSRNVRKLRYHAPVSLKIILTIGLAIGTFGMYRGIADGQMTYAFKSTALLAVPFAFLWFNNAGYRIGYDAEAIYGRASGITRWLRWPPFNRIAFDEIRQLEGRDFRNQPSFSRYLPWRYLAVVPVDSDAPGEPTDPEKREIWIDPEALDDEEMAGLLAALVTARPDLAPEEVVAALRERGHLPALAA